MPKTACKILGTGLALAGIVGFFVPNLPGLHMTPVHNFIYLSTGALTLYFGFTDTIEATQMFSRVFGAVYLLAGIVGFVAPERLAQVFQIQVSVVGPNLMPDNVLHLLLGAVFLIAGFLPESYPVAPTRAGGRLK